MTNRLVLLGVLATWVMGGCSPQDRDREAVREVEQATPPSVQPDTGINVSPVRDADTSWTAGPVDRQGSKVATLMEVRTASHDEYERIVFEFEGAIPGYKIEYIDRPVRACGSDSEDPGAETYVTNLDGAQERPTPVTTTASGTGSVTVNANRTLTYSLAQTGMTPTVQHIHGPASSEESAGVIVAVQLGQNLTLTPANFTGAVSYDSLLVLLRNNRAYFNIHSAEFPGGQIRGNLRRP